MGRPHSWPLAFAARKEAASSGGLTWDLWRAWDLWRGAQAGPWVSAIKTATTGAPAVEQPAHHGVARPAKRIEAAGHSIDRRVILSRSGKTERASPCRGTSLPDRRPGEQQESCRRNRERDLTHVSLIGLGPLSPVGMRDPMQPLILAQFCLGGTRRTSAAAS